MSENIFDRFDIGDLIKHTMGGYQNKPIETYGVVSAIRTHETPILPERKVGVTIRFSNQYNSRVHYNRFNTNHLKHIEVIAKGKI